jgi:hypothetical protein
MLGLLVSCALAITGLIIKKHRAIDMFNNLTKQTNQDFTINRKEIGLAYKEN